MTTTELTAEAVARDWVASFIEMDFERFASHLAPDVRYREVNPSGVDEYTGSAALVAACRRDTESADSAELLSAVATPFGHRIQLTYSARVVAGGTTLQFEELGFVDVVDGKIAAMDFVCSGMIPA